DQRVESNHMGYDRNGKLLQLWADEEGHLEGLPDGGHPLVYEPGCRRMSGPLALDYSRIRYGLPSGDYDRQRHQQEFLKSVLAEATKQGITTKPLKLDAFLRAIGSALTVDTGELSLTDLIFGLRNVTPKTLVGVQVPSYPDMIDGTSYILPEGAATTLYRAIRDDTLDAWVAEHPSWVNPL
ncbi:MAG TPA: LCP family protein, partial [Micromonosporaceae bacterium]|nr:LCP family protein [Micromonosporaceae bacterium]